LQDTAYTMPLFPSYFASMESRPYCISMLAYTMLLASAHGEERIAPAIVKRDYSMVFSNAAALPTFSQVACFMGCSLPDELYGLPVMVPVHKVSTAMSHA
jgi:hypothetical protein